MTKTRGLLFVVVACLLFNAYNTYEEIQNAAGLSDAAHRVTTASHRIGIERRFIFQSCQRLNILRVEDNVNHLADFQVFRVVLQETRPSPTPAASNPQETRFRDAFVAQLARAVAQKTWVPRTDCTHAINQHGTAFRSPRPVKFVTRLPPASALHLEAADF